MAKAEEAPPIEYRIGSGAKWGLLGWSLFLDAIAWTVALAGIALLVLGLVPGAAVITWPMGLAISSAAGILSFAGNVVIYIVFLGLGVSAFTRKFSRVVIKLVVKMIPGLGFFAVFLFPNIVQTWATIRITRLEDKYKWLRKAEMLFAARVALSNKELNAKAWSKLSAAEQQLLESSGLNLNNIEQTAFGKELIEEAKKQKIGAADLPRTLRGAKTERDVMKGLAGTKETGTRLPSQGKGPGIQGDAVGIAGGKPLQSGIKIREEEFLGRVDELTPQQIEQMKQYLLLKNARNKKELEWELMSDEEKQRLYDEYRASQGDQDLLDKEKLDTLRAGELDDEMREPDAEPGDESLFVEDGDDEILRYAKNLDEDDYQEALDEAMRRDPSLTDDYGDEGTIDGAPLTPESVAGAKRRALKQALRGKDIEEALRDGRVEPESLRKRLETELVNAERVLKQRAKSLEQLNTERAKHALNLDDAPEPEYGSLIVALRDKNTSHGHARMLMHLKSREFENVLRSVDKSSQDHARDIRYGNWLERTLEAANTDQLIKEAAEAAKAGTKAGVSPSTQAFEESEHDYRRLLDDAELGDHVKRALADAHTRELEQLRQQGFSDVDAWLRGAVDSGAMDEGEIKKVLDKVRVTRHEIIENPATPESRRRELQESLDAMDKEFGKYLKDQGFEEVQ